MDILTTDLEGVLVIKPDIFRDSRGSFKELWHGRRYQEAGLPTEFVQDNISISARGVVRGLHYQLPHPQGKLVSVLSGEIFDVAVDIRRDSPTFGKWVSEILSAENNRQIYIPVGIAHGFMALSDDTLVIYKCTDYYTPGAGQTICFDDPGIGIDWPNIQPILSVQDASGISLASVPKDLLF